MWLEILANCSKKIGKTNINTRRAPTDFPSYFKYGWDGSGKEEFISKRIQRIFVQKSQGLSMQLIAEVCRCLKNSLEWAFRARQSSIYRKHWDNNNTGHFRDEQMEGNSSGRRLGKSQLWSTDPATPSHFKRRTIWNSQEETRTPEEYSTARGTSLANQWKSNSNNQEMDNLRRFVPSTKRIYPSGPFHFADRMGVLGKFSPWISLKK